MFFPEDSIHVNVQEMTSRGTPKHCDKKRVKNNIEIYNSTVSLLFVKTAARAQKKKNKTKITLQSFHVMVTLSFVNILIGTIRHYLTSLLYQLHDAEYDTAFWLHENASSSYIVR